jgi:hypothetical protein
LIVYDGSWLAAGGLRYYECLDVEASHEILASPSVLIGLDVALIPSQPKRRIGKLDHKEIKLGIRWKPLYVDDHHLNRPPRDNCHFSVDALEAIAVLGRS